MEMLHILNYALKNKQQDVPMDIKCIIRDALMDNSYQPICTVITDEPLEPYADEYDVCLEFLKHTKEYTVFLNADSLNRCIDYANQYIQDLHTYYDHLAEEEAMRQEWKAMSQYGPCYDDFWTS